MVLENFLRAHEENTSTSAWSPTRRIPQGKRDDEELKSVQAWTDLPARCSRHKASFTASPPPACRGRRYLRKPNARSNSWASRHLIPQAQGSVPDDDEARPFWELVQDLDVPVMIHPPHLGFGEGA